MTQVAAEKKIGKAAKSLRATNVANKFRRDQNIRWCCCHPGGLGPDHRAAVGVEYLAADVGSLVARQKNVTRRHLVGLTAAPHRARGAMLGDMLGIEGRGDERGPDRPGRDGIDPDPLLNQHFRKRSREAHDRAFGRGIAEQGLVTLERRDRGGVDDRGACLR